MTKYFLGITVLLTALLSVIENPVNAVYCCSQSDPSTCAAGISVDRYYCYATMTDCQNGTCDASY